MDKYISQNFISQFRSFDQKDKNKLKDLVEDGISTIRELREYGKIPKYALGIVASAIVTTPGKHRSTVSPHWAFQDEKEINIDDATVACLFELDPSDPIKSFIDHVATIEYIYSDNKRAEELIELLDLIPHEEGGYYKEVYRSENTVESPLTGTERNWVTDIYFLLMENQVSRFHRVLHDEIWHFYEGSPLKLVEIDQDSLDVKYHLIGQKEKNPAFKHIVRGGNWQAAKPTGEYSLVGCTVAPGFDFEDFDFLSDDKESADKVLRKHPELTVFI